MRRFLIPALLLLGGVTAIAQDLKSGPYDLPYKNTYVKNIFVSENAFRTMKPETKTPKSFKEAQKILSDTAANVYIQDLADYVVLNPEFTGYEFYPLYAADFSKIHPV